MRMCVCACVYVRACVSVCAYVRMSTYLFCINIYIYSQQFQLILCAVNAHYAIMKVVTIHIHPMYTVQCTLHTVVCTLYSVYIVYSTSYTVLILSKRPIYSYYMSHYIKYILILS